MLREVLQDVSRVDIDRLSRIMGVSRKNIIYYLDGSSLLGNFTEKSFKYCRRELNGKQIYRKIDVRGDKLGDYIGVTLYWFRGKLYNRRLQPVIVEEVEKLVDKRLSTPMSKGIAEEKIKRSSGNNVADGAGDEMGAITTSTEIDVADKIKKEVETVNNKDVASENYGPIDLR